MVHSKESGAGALIPAAIILGVLVGALAGGPAADSAGTTSTEMPPGIGMMVYVNGEAVADYRPTPALRTTTTCIPAAQVPRGRRALPLGPGGGSRSNDPGDGRAEREPRGQPERRLRRSRWTGCSSDSTTGHPIDSSSSATSTSLASTSPTSARAMAEFLEDAHARGVRGLKIFKDLGLRIRDGSGQLVRVDDARLDPIWAECGELGMPVLIHTADPVAFFQPLDAYNERWMQLKRHPSWSFFDGQHPARDELLRQRNRVLDRHPETMFIGAHVGGNAEDLAAAGRVLDSHPNLYLDISGRVAELGRQPYAARAVLPPVPGPPALRHRSLSWPERPAAVPDLLPVPGNRRRALRLLRPPVSAGRRLEDLRPLPSGRGPGEDLPRERRSPARHGAEPSLERTRRGPCSCNRRFCAAADSSCSASCCGSGGDCCTDSSFPRPWSAAWSD